MGPTERLEKLGKKCSIETEKNWILKNYKCD